MAGCAPRATELLADYLEGIAELDVTEPPGIDICRAARIISSYMSDDAAGIDTETHAAVTDRRGTETFRQSWTRSKLHSPN